MIKEYYIPKSQYSKKEIKSLYLVFDNGDFVELGGSIIASLSINVADRLIKSHHGFNFVVSNGYIKFDVANKNASSTNNYSLYNENEFKKNRKLYIENRCLNESNVTEIWLFNNGDEYQVLHCDTKAYKKGKFLILEFQSTQHFTDFSSDKAVANIKDIKKADVFKIELGFENCEGLTIYKSEIRDFKLNFDDALAFFSGNLLRKVTGGYILVKFDKYYNGHNYHSFDNNKINVADIIKRLCENKNVSIHDICYLNIDYNHAGCTNDTYCEQIVVDDIKSEEEIEALLREEEQTFEEKYLFEGGYCKKVDKDTVLITFGTKGKETIAKLSANL